MALDKESLDEELLKEIASVGGDYGRRLELIIEDLKRTERAYRYLKHRLSRQRGTPLFTLRLMIRLRKRFLKVKEKGLILRKNLIIYREALGLIKHREVFEIYNLEAFRL